MGCEEGLGVAANVVGGECHWQSAGFSYLGCSSTTTVRMGKATKATRKFASSGQLKKTIRSRKKHQEIKKKIESRRGTKSKGKSKATVQDDGNEQDDVEDEAHEMDIDQDGSDAEWDAAHEIDVDQDGSDAEEDEEDVPDDESFASVDDLEGTSSQYRWLVPNPAPQTRALYTCTNFLSSRKRIPSFTSTSKKMTESCSSLTPKTRSMTRTTKRRTSKWKAKNCPSSQKTSYADGKRLYSMYVSPCFDPRLHSPVPQYRSLRALRKLLIAFRSAAHMNEDNQSLAWRIDSSTSKAIEP